VLNFVLARRNGSVLLAQRPSSSSLMPLMWDLPALAARPETEPALKLRHSITTTDYAVLVFADRGRRVPGGRWVPLPGMERMALTGLARKILSRLELLPSR
jgi:A/G-specific adenine glycosylase